MYVGTPAVVIVPSFMAGVEEKREKGVAGSADGTRASGVCESAEKGSTNHFTSYLCNVILALFKLDHNKTICRE